MHSVIIVTHLMIPNNNCNNPQKRLGDQRQTNQEVLNEGLRRSRRPLIFKHNPSAENGYYTVLCADGHFSGCKPVLAHLERNVCVWCNHPKHEVGDYVPPDKQHPRREYILYRTLSDANPKAADAKLWLRHAYWAFNEFRHVPCTVSNLAKPDLLHSMQIGMLDHLQMWIFNFMKTHEPLDKYNLIWLSMAAYHDLTVKNESYEEVSQWNGQEMKEMSRYLLGAVTQSLWCGSPTPCLIFNQAIECTGALLEF